MKKLSFLNLCFILISTLFFGACSAIKDEIYNSFFMNEQDEQELAHNKTEQLLKAIENKDKDSIKQMFSKAVISEGEIFDEEIDMLFEYFRGEVKNVIDASCVGSGESGEEGSIKIADFQSVVTTTEDKYVLTTRYYISDTVTRDRIGIYSFNILNLEEYRKYDKPEKQENIEYEPGINFSYIKQWADYHGIGIAEYGKENS